MTELQDKFRKPNDAMTKESGSSLAETAQRFLEPFLAHALIRSPVVWPGYLEFVSARLSPFLDRCRLGQGSWPG